MKHRTPDMIAIVTIKTTLKRLIADSGITVTHLSRATKIPAQTLHNWLAGAEPKSLTQLKKVADYFDVSLDYLCFGKEPKPKKVLNEYESEINAGIFEVVLRKVKRQ
ncbi:helix-turn-helix domain-containing protein [Peredibacter starrii]|uniref:Helix-turn-helix transcriptional regulator n=1 Tax=Peredibacter starrii TaxID=28202 RepID=A0AAX4HRC0_9BACT|nr:helix-turn-helix transcriptional regulator [Peredibacter starrii]WPU65905.1 helix-turn-helix transcriptional regulator [Peredibacter starrii]